MKKNNKQEQKGSDFATFEIFDGKRYLYNVPVGQDPFEEYDAICGNLQSPRLVQVRDGIRSEIA